eukprot:CAMPEP_0113501938 /NCGR_PEP_ID=MMETSP0014_2-20120614/33250_1 /TAXON_ID=2857 /ORGANISM="Nitzschia sp." /LENGTH=93 /DNA_ID=CAMNT_0000396617 /DNA_START=421 /DNA_END=701 /DNA_ORIENTATION=+ /assembly_acc=CAM_ASM_000159
MTSELEKQHLYDVLKDPTSHGDVSATLKAGLRKAPWFDDIAVRNTILLLWDKICSGAKVIMEGTVRLLQDMDLGLIPSRDNIVCRRAVVRIVS